MDNELLQTKKMTWSCDTAMVCGSALVQKGCWFDDVVSSVLSIFHVWRLLNSHYSNRPKSCRISLLKLTPERSGNGRC